MNEEKELQRELEEIDNIDMTGSVQTKKGWYYVVINYKYQNIRKNKWKSTGIKDVPGNKKLAKSTVVETINKYKEELKKNIRKKYEEKAKENEIPFAPLQLLIELENEENNTSGEETLDEIRLNKYKKMSFLAFIKESLEEFKSRLAQTTYDSWLNIYECRISDYFRVIPLNERPFMMNPEIERNIYYNSVPKVLEITQFDIEDFMQWLADCNLKGSSRDKYYVLFQLVFARAVRKKLIKNENNPMTNVPKPHIDPYIPDYYKPSELKILFDIVKDDILEVPILFAGTYGLRRSEILGLKWSAIDFENDTFVIKHTVTKVKGSGENQIIDCKDLTKSPYGYRSYPLTADIKNSLTKQKLNIECNKRYVYGDKYVKQTAEYVCVKENGELIKPDHLSHRFQLLAKKAELKKIRLHDIRHSVGSLLAEKNVNLKQIQEYLGHGSIRSTVRYAHLQYENKKDSLNVINNLLATGT